ncbi:MAG TPA: polyphosphate kinase 1, partial [Candidatus Obscuribacterales bacterium]
FMVRVPLLKSGSPNEAIAAEGESLAAPSFPHIQPYLRALMERQYAHFTSNLVTALAQQGVHLADYSALTDLQRRHCHHRFEDEVAPVLTALITPPPARPPDFSNLSLNLAVAVTMAEGTQLGWVKLPRVLPRFLVMAGPQPQAWVAVPLEQVIAAHLEGLFPAGKVVGCFPFRVTRSADLGTLDSETANLMQMIQEGLQQRQQQGQAVRLEVGRSLPPWIATALTAALAIAPTDIYRLSGWLGLSDLTALTRLPRPDLLDPPWEPVLPPALLPPPKLTMLSFTAAARPSELDLFRAIAQQDLLLHFPYHSFSATVEQFVAQAAADPAVLTIKMTLYRTAVDAPIVRSLIAAAKTGKQIVVLVELTAPLDEAINIHWAQSLEKAGAHVVYGVVGFRTHTNLVLVVRREGQQIRQYAYIGTGDYLPDRPQPYEDLGLLTCSPAIGRDLSRLFNFLTGCSRENGYSTIMVAPIGLKAQLQALIQREADHAQQGKPARLIAKLNLLADPDIIAALYAASQLGVEIDLIVRGICCLRPGVPGLSDRIRVISLLGSTVEHSRILYCQNDTAPQAWIGTADWTPRGLNERIEVMVPLHPPALVAAIDDLLALLLSDTQNAWHLCPDGRYVRPPASAQRRSAQQLLQQAAHQASRLSP